MEKDRVYFDGASYERTFRTLCKGSKSQLRSPKKEKIDQIYNHLLLMCRDFISLSDEVIFIQITFQYLKLIYNYYKSKAFPFNRNHFVQMRTYCNPIATLINHYHLEDLFVKTAIPHTLQWILQEKTWEQINLLVIFLQCAGQSTNFKPSDKFPFSVLMELITTTGHYQSQSIFVEIMFRLHSIRDLKLQAHLEIIDSETLPAFLSISTTEASNQNVRDFLNHVNENRNDLVHSIICQDISIGNLTCQKPKNSEEVNGIWVDFNMQHKCLSWYADAKDIIDEVMTELSESDTTTCLFTLCFDDIQNVEHRIVLGGVELIIQFVDALVSSISDIQGYVLGIKEVRLVLPKTAPSKTLLNKVMPDLLGKKYSPSHQISFVISQELSSDSIRSRLSSLGEFHQNAESDSSGNSTILDLNEVYEKKLKTIDLTNDESIVDLVMPDSPEIIFPTNIIENRLNKTKHLNIDQLISGTSAEMKKQNYGFSPDISIEDLVENLIEEDMRKCEFKSYDLVSSTPIKQKDKDEVSSPNKKSRIQATKRTDLKKSSFHEPISPESLSSDASLNSFVDLENPKPASQKKKTPKKSLSELLSPDSLSSDPSLTEGSPILKSKQFTRTTAIVPKILQFPEDIEWKRSPSGEGCITISDNSSFSEMDGKIGTESDKCILIDDSDSERDDELTQTVDVKKRPQLVEETLSKLHRLKDVSVFEADSDIASIFDESRQKMRDRKRHSSTSPIVTVTSSISDMDSSDDESVIIGSKPTPKAIKIIDNVVIREAKKPFHSDSSPASSKSLSIEQKCMIKTTRKEIIKLPINEFAELTFKQKLSEEELPTIELSEDGPMEEGEKLDQLSTPVVTTEEITPEKPIEEAELSRVTLSPIEFVEDGPMEEEENFDELPTPVVKPKEITPEKPIEEAELSRVTLSPIEFVEDGSMEEGDKLDQLSTPVVITEEITPEKTIEEAELSRVTLSPIEFVEDCDKSPMILDIPGIVIFETEDGGIKIECEDDEIFKNPTKSLDNLIPEAPAEADSIIPAQLENIETTSLPIDKEYKNVSEKRTIHEIDISPSRKVASPVHLCELSVPLQNLHLSFEVEKSPESAIPLNTKSTECMKIIEEESVKKARKAKAMEAWKIRIRERVSATEKRTKPIGATKKNAKKPSKVSESLGNLEVAKILGKSLSSDSGSDNVPLIAFAKRNEISPPNLDDNVLPVNTMDLITEEEQVVESVISPEELPIVNTQETVVADYTELFDVADNSPTTMNDINLLNKSPEPVNVPHVITIDALSEIDTNQNDVAYYNRNTIQSNALLLDRIDVLESEKILSKSRVSNKRKLYDANTDKENLSPIADSNWTPVENIRSSYVPPQRNVSKKLKLLDAFDTGYNTSRKSFPHEEGRRTVCIGGIVSSIKIYKRKAKTPVCTFTSEALAKETESFKNGLTSHAHYIAVLDSLKAIEKPASKRRKPNAPKAKKGPNEPKKPRAPRKTNSKVVNNKTAPNNRIDQVRSQINSSVMDPELYPSQILPIVNPDHNYTENNYSDFAGGEEMLNSSPVEVMPVENHIDDFNTVIQHSFSMVKRNDLRSIDPLQKARSINKLQKTVNSVKDFFKLD